jgi:GntR family transcriptional regulator
MVFDLDFRSHVPIYVQIMERIKSLIATGQLGSGDQLPTVRQLAADLRVNFNTVARAYRLLDEAGVISTQQGRGTYVLQPLSEGESEHLRQAALDGLIRSFLSDAARLGFDAQAVSQATDALLRRWKQSGQPPDEDE